MRSRPVPKKTDAIAGEDGKPRCPWAGATTTTLTRYHDEV